jgi:hypothetical protein
VRKSPIVIDGSAAIRENEAPAERRRRGGEAKIRDRYDDTVTALAGGNGKPVAGSEW